MRAAVVIFPGSNADAELVRTLVDVTGIATSTVWHRETELPANTDLVAIPGGFAHGDYLRCGAIAKTSPIVHAIRQHAEDGGYVLGICNGFQILTEAGLLKGALTRNSHLRFECRNVFVTPSAPGPFTNGLPKVLELPIAHAEGRFHADAETLRELHDNNLIAFRYCSREGTTSSGNPNGSIDNIAGVYGGPHRNVMGLMPHPERMSESIHGCIDGRYLFDAVLNAFEKRS